MADRLVLDTNILIDFFRKRPEAIAFVRGLMARPVVSAITVAELFTGVREGAERRDVEEFLFKCVVVDIDEQIATRAGLILRQYRKSHNVGLADALIAATGEADAARIATLNTKHFPTVAPTDLVKPY